MTCRKKGDQSIEKQVEEMNMDDVIALVNTNRGKGRKHNLKRMYALLDELGNPQKEMKYIHIAGTNGKGSTSSFLLSILETAGYRVGLFTSPHLEKIHERIRINNVLISDEDWIQLTKKVASAVTKIEAETGESLYAFEILTAGAFLYFSTQKSDLVLLEVGIGGRLDATNTIDESLVSVITSIGLDHVKMLGDTVEKIAQEKVGILKERGELVTFSPSESVDRLFKQAAKEKKAQYSTVQEDKIHLVKTTQNRQVFDYKDMHTLSIQARGYHQIQNAVLAIEVTEKLIEKGYHISEEALRRGLATASWPGRWEQISESPLAFLDGAHNQPATAALIATIKELFPNQKVTFILGMMEDKDYESMVDAVLPLANKFLTLSPESDRAVKGSRMGTLLQERGFKAQALSSASEVLEYIDTRADKDEVIIVFGSLYLVGNIKREIKKLLH